MLMICAILRAYMGQSGRSSGVERNLAKVEVVGSNPIARSNTFNGLYGLIFCSEPMPHLVGDYAPFSKISDNLKSWVFAAAIASGIASPASQVYSFSRALTTVSSCASRSSANPG